MRKNIFFVQELRGSKKDFNSDGEIRAICERCENELFATQFLSRFLHSVSSIKIFHIQFFTSQRAIARDASDARDGRDS